jgi:hypothetical protein
MKPEKAGKELGKSIGDFALVYDSLREQWIVAQPVRQLMTDNLGKWSDSITLAILSAKETLERKR